MNQDHRYGKHRVTHAFSLFNNLIRTGNIVLEQIEPVTLNNMTKTTNQSSISLAYRVIKGVFNAPDGYFIHTHKYKNIAE
jgi:hypothetical protein